MKYRIRIYFMQPACQAVIATRLTISSTEQPRERSLIGAAIPCRIGPIASTMMACPGMEQEDAFTKALEATTHFDMDGPMLLLLCDCVLKAVFQAKP